MTKRLIIALPLLTAAALLSACDSHHNDTFTTPASADFSSFVQTLITEQTCASATPVDVNSIAFTFDAGQDAATPVDVSGVNPNGCSA